MSAIAIAIAGALFVLGLFVGRVTQTSSPTAEIPTATPTLEASPTATLVQETPTPQQTGIKPSSPTSRPSPTPSKGETQGVSTYINTFLYPSGIVVQKTTTVVEIESTDDPSNITSWHEQQFKNHGFSTRSSAKTNSNGTIINKLAGGKGNTTISVTIQKKSNETKTHITVEETLSENGTDIRIQINNEEKQ